MSTSTTSVTAGPVYDAAYLQELKASTPNARPPVAKAAMSMETDAYEADISMDIDTVADLGMTIDGESRHWPKSHMKCADTR